MKWRVVIVSVPLFSSRRHWRRVVSDEGEEGKLRWLWLTMKLSNSLLCLNLSGTVDAEALQFPPLPESLSQILCSLCSGLCRSTSGLPNLSTFESNWLSRTQIDRQNIPLSTRTKILPLVQWKRQSDDHGEKGKVVEDSSVMAIGGLVTWEQ
ncbi:hypothetical protein K1719_018598 [Acacia pycnantha]|nr:hypothetical protein K1719_018598 [Acacia pycnantha]